MLIGLALFLTLLIMQPVATDMYHKGWEPLENGQVTWQQAFDDGSQAAEGFPGALRPGKRRPPVSGYHACAAAATARPIWA